MDGLYFIALHQIAQVFIRRAAFIQRLSRPFDKVCLRPEIIGHHQVIFLAVQQNRHRIPVIAVALVGDFHIAQRAVQTAPHAPEIILKNAAFPIRHNIVVRAEAQQDILLRVGIVKLEGQRGKNVDRLAAQRHCRVAVLIHRQRHVLPAYAV
ncbi:hypothetical protein SDC9_88133 [bioreactor metagenome]|uniref:Uncharacterized protein n=1 Tax=bioreactor metagenome TaxID=1076179 RepID=A0A644ZM88_9ZZZZ